MASERGTTSFIQETLIPLLSGVIDLGQSGNRWKTIWTQAIDASGVVTISRTPTAGTDAANKTYVDTTVVGLTVREVDLVPSIAAVTILEFNQANGFVVSNPVGNNARVDLSAIPTSALAGPITAAKGGTNIDTSASTGIPKVSAGTWTVPTLVGVADGGTNVASYAAKGDILVSSGATTLTKLAVGADNTLLTADSTQATGVKWGSAIAVPRSYLAGLTLSTAGSSTTMTIAAGQAVDSTNVDTLTLAASTGKTTGAWVVGSGNGGLDTGAIANSTWYHFWLIKRTDTGVVDVLISLSATAPTMPANYTERRRIGSGLTTGAGNWTSFTQDGDYFRWAASVLDVNTNNPGTAAVTVTLGSVPTGVNVFALINGAIVNTDGTSAGDYYVSELSANDEAPSRTAAPLASGPTTGGTAGASVEGQVQLLIRTNTSAQIRYRVTFSNANVNARIATLGWIDSRGRNN